MLILVGASATGKTEIAKELIKNYDMEKMVTYTTRKKRIGEKEGIDYHFISEDEFLKIKDNNGFVETILYNNHYYGTLKKDVDSNKVVILEPNGLNAFYKEFKDGIVSFLIISSKQDRKKRMINRGDLEENINGRLKSDDEKFNQKNIEYIDLVLNNGPEDKISSLAQTIYQYYQEKITK